MRPQFLIYATLVLSTGVFVVNLFVAILSDSHAVFSQALYTITDVVGGLLILWGSRVSQRPPDPSHPFGRGKERFFWAFAATLVTFSTSGLIVLLEGLAQVFAPTPVTHLNLTVIVVAATLLTSVIGILVTLRELERNRETVQTLIDSAHQGLKTIFYQDIVAVFGSAVVLAGTSIDYVTHQYVVDGIAAAIVGAILIATGFVLVGETREFLIGRSIPPAQAAAILLLVERDANVRKVRGLQSMMLGPEDALLAMRVNFQDGLTTDQIEATIDQLSSSVRSQYPGIRHLIIEPES